MNEEAQQGIDPTPGTRNASYPNPTQLRNGDAARGRAAELPIETSHSHLGEANRWGKSPPDLGAKSSHSTEKMLSGNTQDVSPFELKKVQSANTRIIPVKRKKLNTKNGDRDVAPLAELKKKIKWALDHRLRAEERGWVAPENQERCDWEINEERKLFKTLNPLPLQVLALRSAGAACLSAQRNITEFVPKTVLKNCKVFAIIVSREQPGYPVRGVSFD